MAAKTAPVGRAAVERAAMQEHIGGCSSCRYALADHNAPLALCATGTVLWSIYQDAKMRRTSTRVEFAFERVNGRIEVRSLDTPTADEALALHNYLGTHVCACTGPECGCVQYGIDLGRQEGKEPLR